MLSSSGPAILSVPPYQFSESGFFSLVTNTVLSTWIFMVIVIGLSYILYQASKHERWGFLRTTGYLIVKHLIRFFEPLIGRNLIMHKVLWLCGGVFLYIVGANLFSIFLEWFVSFVPSLHIFIRPINSDINTTLGMALCMILISHGIMIKTKGVFGYLGNYLFHFQGNTLTDKIINVFVGWLHLIGEVVRVVALSLRLFGNIFAGAVLLAVMWWITSKIAPYGLPIGNLLMVPFYFFEMFIGFIQAMVFSLLVALYFKESSETTHH